MLKNEMSILFFVCVFFGEASVLWLYPGHWLLISALPQQSVETEAQRQEDKGREEEKDVDKGSVSLCLQLGSSCLGVGG